jgi:hypothetical protein
VCIIFTHDVAFIRKTVLTANSLFSCVCRNTWVLRMFHSTSYSEFALPRDRTCGLWNLMQRGGYCRLEGYNLDFWIWYVNRHVLKVDGLFIQTVTVYFLMGGTRAGKCTWVISINYNWNWSPITLHQCSLYSSRVWIPLTDAPPLNSCIHVKLVYHSDHTWHLGTRLQGIPLYACCSGDVLCWFGRLLHFRSRASRWTAHKR